LKQDQARLKARDQLRKAGHKGSPLAILSLSPPAAETAGVWSASKHDEIIKRLMADVGMPNSNSLYGAFKQFANELHALATPADTSASVVGDDNLLSTIDAIIADNVYVDNDGVAGISAAAEAVLAALTAEGGKPGVGSGAQAAPDAADAARYRYLKEHASYYYHEGHNPPTPREFGIEWHWQDGTPERLDMDALIDREIEENRALVEVDADEGVLLPSTQQQCEHGNHLETCTVCLMWRSLPSTPPGSAAE
jgi:hypothetical protein